MSKARRPQMTHPSSVGPVVAPGLLEVVPVLSQLPDDLQKIQDLLEAGRPEDALKIAVGRGSGGPIHANARAVCLMRIGKTEEAVKTLRSVALEGGGVFLRAQAPLACKINFATALALSGNPGGAINVLSEIKQEDDPRVQALREAIRRWEKGLSLWEWIQWKGGVSINLPVPLDFPPGTLI